MGQLVGCIHGIGEACHALDMPVVSGNVSLYNETDGAAILPTPTIGAVGLLESLDRVIPMAAPEDAVLVLLGASLGHLGQSALLWELFARAEGPAPRVDLAAERRAGELVRSLHRDGLIAAAHDLSDGGLAVAAAEMALAAGTGLRLEAAERLGPLEWFFGEDQGRYLVAAPDETAADAVLDAARIAGVPAARVGEMGGDRVRLGSASVPLARLRARHESGFPRLMGEKAV
jgi:phosphoribosylformylglycinamidine synthase